MISRLFPAVSLIIAIGLFFGYINPTRTGSIAETQAQIDSYDSALLAAERFKEKEGELIVERANIPSDGLARLEAFLPDGVDNVQIILDLNTLAARSGMKLSDFDTATPSDAVTTGDPAFSLESAGPVESLDITVSATGTYESFRTFLDGIERSLRILDVVSVEVTDSATGVYTYTMTVRLYWLR
ncbi:MAG TPA: hypothetical protein VGB97_04755 [Candidatus Paceibacterota bacterium]|jgi:hypothetical protein